jgi:superoxide dismutase, Cu-Zn family
MAYKMGGFMKTKFFSIAAGLFWFAVFILCVELQANAQMKGNMSWSDKTTKAICVLTPTQGNTVSGIVTFIRVEGGIKVVADVHGLSAGMHGIHIHEFGDCSAPDAVSAGGHFNPEGKSHGAPMDSIRHRGDLGNIVADQNGDAHLEYVDPMITLEGSHSIIGHSVILHKNKDDLKSQPAGNAGPRVACGVIGVGK